MKKFKFLVGAVALFALVVANVWNAATTFSGSDLEITNVESIAAEAEDDGIELRQKGKASPDNNCTYSVLVAVYQCGAEVEEGGYYHEGCKYGFVYNNYGWVMPCYKDPDKSYLRKKTGHRRECDYSDDTFCFATRCH